MRVFLALILGLLVGAGVVWVYVNHQPRNAAQTPAEQLGNAAKSAGDAITDRVRSLNLRPEDIKDELARTGRVVRQKARAAGQAIADATADTRTTAAIKGKLIADPDLSALTISVNTTAGVVTLSGTVSAPEYIGKAILLAMETEGVREVISTLQVKSKS
jgi:hypothetical protein